MSNTPGAIIVIAKIEAPDGAAFSPLDDSQVSGGAHAVADLAARNALPAHLLTPGTTATLPDGTWFVWSGSAWATPPGSGGLVTSVAGRIGDVVLSTADISGLGNSATRNVGTTAGTVAAGDDARMTNARAPTAHASTHATGGSDQLAPAAIGAEVAGAAAAAVSAHTGAADPHGDRAFATAAVAAITPASIGAEVAGTTATHAALTTAHGESAFGATFKTSTGAPAARSTLGLPASATRTITHSSSPPSGGVAGDIHFQIP